MQKAEYKAMQNSAPVIIHNTNRTFLASVKKKKSMITTRTQRLCPSIAFIREIKVMLDWINLLSRDWNE